MGSISPTIELDVLVIGAGFGGCYLLHLLRDAGFKTQVVEAGSAIGGVWAWNVMFYHLDTKARNNELTTSPEISRSES